MSDGGMTWRREWVRRVQCGAKIAASDWRVGWLCKNTNCVECSFLIALCIAMKTFSLFCATDFFHLAANKICFRARKLSASDELMNNIFDPCAKWLPMKYWALHLQGNVLVIFYYWILNGLWQFISLYSQPSNALSRIIIVNLNHLPFDNDNSDTFWLRQLWGFDPGTFQFKVVNNVARQILVSIIN